MTFCVHVLFYEAHLLIYLGVSKKNAKKLYLDLEGHIIGSKRLGGCRIRVVCSVVKY